MLPHPAPQTPNRRTLVIACGALARELLAVIEINRLDHLSVTCLPAIWHNRPEKIPEGVRRKIRAARGRYDEILCLYGDCGTGGQLDAVLVDEFERLQEEELGTFYLTDYLVRHFDRLMIRGMGLDRYPQLLPDYFGHYKRVVYLAQVDDPVLTRRAEVAAARLGLAFERRFTGYGGLAGFVAPSVSSATGAPGHG